MKRQPLLVVATDTLRTGKRTVALGTVLHEQRRTVPGHGRLEHRSFEKATRPIVFCKELLYVVAQALISGADVSKERNAFVSRALERLFKELLDLLPSFRRHPRVVQSSVSPYNTETAPLAMSRVGPDSRPPCAVTRAFEKPLSSWQ